jgi:aminoglycoside phosphotransferase (APT) family kinase protein
MNPWDAQWPWTEAEAAEAIARIAPELTGEVSLLGQGWDCLVFRIGDAVWRFAKRPAGLECLENELRVLPQLPDVGLPVPRPRWTGEARGRPIYGHDYIHGHSADHLALNEDERAQLAPSLGVFLKGLHAQPRLEGLHDDWTRVDLQDTARRLKSRYDIDEVAPPSTEDRWVCHGDLYARHVAVERGPVRVTGILDWGDVCWGDRAVDLSLAFAFLPPEARPAFFDAYGAIDAWTEARARFFARYYGYVLEDYAADVDDKTLLAEAAVITELSRR